MMTIYSTSFGTEDNHKRKTFFFILTNTYIDIITIHTYIYVCLVTRMYIYVIIIIILFCFVVVGGAYDVAEIATKRRAV